jgi:hypothetical protein
MENLIRKIERENALVAEKYLVTKELIGFLYEGLYDRTTITSVMLRELRGKINEMLKNDF